ncbi:uncharacterized protein DS421_2g38000 [Arachis hypogaea]|nr:uncharacterized protein DS421_2g38000 [Arachis hypogaea]
MDEFEVVHVFHHGRNFKRNAQSKLEYVVGKVKKWPPLHIDLVNFDFETLLKELGYTEYKTIFWFDSMAPDLESGLHVIRGDVEINDMRNNKIKNNGTNEIYIYFDHPVSVPEIVDEEMQAEEVIMSDSSSSSEREMSTTNAKKTFAVTCSKCGQKGHYYKTCPNTAQDSNWKPMTKKERRAQKKTTTHNSSTDPTTSTDQVQECHEKTSDLNANATTVGSTSDSVAIGENSNDNPTPFKEKHQIIRPPTPCFVPPPIPAPTPTLWFKSQPFQAPNLMPHTSQLQSNDSIAGKTTPKISHDAISEETMVAANSTTASRLLKFVPTPGYRPPGFGPPKQG